MIISNSRKFIFVHVHKTAGSALKLAVEPHLSWNDIVLGGTPYGESLAPAYEKAHGLHKHSTITEIAKVVGEEVMADYHSFALVREPVARIVSLYNYVADLFRVEGITLGIDHDEMVEAARQHNPRYAHPILEWKASQAYYTTPDFSGFIRSELLAEDMGFRPQIESLQSRNGKIMVDQIFKHEHLLRDLPKIWDKLGCRFLLQHWNRPKTYRMSPADVAPDDRDYLRARFADDYTAFDYD